MRPIARTLGAVVLLVLSAGWTGLAPTAGAAASLEDRPNILVAIADDWGWPHAGAYGDPVVLTPTFDRLAREGVLFDHAYVASPSCTPSRAATLTGQWHWRLEESANPWSTLRRDYAVYPELLARAGYHVGCRARAGAPGVSSPAGGPRTPPVG